MGQNTGFLNTDIRYRSLLGHHLISFIFISLPHLMPPTQVGNVRIGQILIEALVRSHHSKKRRTHIPPKWSSSIQGEQQQPRQTVTIAGVLSCLDSQREVTLAGLGVAFLLLVYRSHFLLNKYVPGKKRLISGTQLELQSLKQDNITLLISLKLPSNHK